MLSWGNCSQPFVTGTSCRFRRQRTPKSGVENQVASRSSVKLTFGRSEVVFQQNCLIITCRTFWTMSLENTAVSRAVDPELSAVIGAQLCLEAWWHNSRSWREHLCWPGERGYFAAFRLSYSPFMSFWDDLFSSFFFPFHILHALYALSQCLCFVRLLPLHLSQNLVHG